MVGAAGALSAGSSVQGCWGVGPRRWWKAPALIRWWPDGRGLCMVVKILGFPPISGWSAWGRRTGCRQRPCPSRDMVVCGGFIGLDPPPGQLVHGGSTPARCGDRVSEEARAAALGDAAASFVLERAPSASVAGLWWLLFIFGHMVALQLEKWMSGRRFRDGGVVGCTTS
jgi:hypothetical protein